MAKDLGLSCPLCLDVNDPDDMLPVKIGHKHPPSIVEIHLCADCFQAVIRAVKEQLDSQEGVSSDDTRDGGLSDTGERRPDDSGSPIVLDEAAMAAPAVDHAPDASAIVEPKEKTISSERE